MAFFRRFLVPFLALLLLVGGSFLLWNWRHGTTGDGAFVTLEHRVIDNVTCSGSCEHVQLTSDQYPGTVYFSSEDTLSCIPVVLWANQIRDDQVGMNGYAFYDGGQVNLRPITVDASALDGDPVMIRVPRTVEGSTQDSDAGVFSVQLRNTGEWNLIDPSSFHADSGEGFVVKTDNNSGMIELWNGCSDAARNIATYVIYQAPDLAFAGEDPVYRVSVTRRGAYGESQEEADVTVFEHLYSSQDMTHDSVHVDVTDGERTFGFDLVNKNE